MLEELLPQKFITRILPRSRFLAIAIGGLLGLLFPMCECGIIPVMRRLLRKGLPVSCCIAYLLAGPIINVVVMLSTYLAFEGKEGTPVPPGMAPQMGGLWMMGLRMGLGYLVAIGTSLIVDWQYRKHGNKLLTPLATPSGLPMVDEDARIAATVDRRAHHEHRADRPARFRGHHGLPDPRRPDRLADAAADLAGHRGRLVSNDYPYLAIGIMMVLAVVLCLCSEADAFVAASYATMRPAAKVAFLVLGPMLDFKLYFMYTRVFRTRLIWTIFLSVIVQTFVYSMAVHVIWENYGRVHAGAPWLGLAAVAAPSTLSPLTGGIPLSEIVHGHARPPATATAGPSTRNSSSPSAPAAPSPG